MSTPDQDPIADRLRARFGAPGYQPPMLPRVAMQILTLSQRPEVEIEEVLRVLESDPVLAAQVLRLAQSALYARTSPIRSMRQAVVRLGLREMRNAVFEIALRLRVFRAKGYEAVLGSLRRHSTAVAHLSRLVAAEAGLDHEFAFLCGLLHDVGLAACLLVLADEDKPPLHLAWPALDAVHEEASAIVVSLWKLPAELGAVLRHHHPGSMATAEGPYAAVICVAHLLADQVGASLSPPIALEPLSSLERDGDGIRSQACELLGIDAQRLFKLCEAAAVIAGELDSAALAA